MKTRKVSKGNLPINVSPDCKLWLDIYRDLGVTLSPALLPAAQDGYWYVVNDKRVTITQIYTTCQKYFECVKFVDLSKVTNLGGKGITTVRFFSANEGADKGYEGRLIKNGNVLNPDSINLKERMLLELWYFKKTGKHLDIKNWVRCGSSCDDSGRMLYAAWDSGNKTFTIHWTPPSAFRISVVE